MKNIIENLWNVKNNMKPTLQEKIYELIQNKKPIKLHLGCGNKLLEDYINIDGEYMIHDQRIIFHDITKEFPIMDNIVDEILSVHVIEHIYKHLLIPMFLEWRRILKPGGFVAIEWPDLLKACKEVVSNPDCFWSENPDLKKCTLKSIYSDASMYPDLEMIHKWGYSNEYMIKLLKIAGYSNVEEQTNLYGKSFVDSRVVAYK